MSDMREFANSSEPVLESSFRPVEREDFSDQKIDLSSEGIGDIRPLDETSDMSAFHTTEPEEGSNTGKIVGALAVALMIGGAGVYAYTASMSSKAPTAVATVPVSPPKVAAVTSPAPPPAAEPAATDTSAAPVPAESAPVKTARTSKPRPTASVETPSPAPVVTQEQPAAQPSPAIGANQQAATVPEPVSPTAPSSAVAAIPAPVTPPSTTAQDMPAPSPDVQAQNPGVQPAPAEQTQPAAPEQTAPQQ